MIAHVRYLHFKIRTWLWGFLVIFLYLVWFSLCSSIFSGNCATKESWKFLIFTLKPRRHVRILIYRGWAKRTNAVVSRPYPLLFLVHQNRCFFIVLVHQHCHVKTIHHYEKGQFPPPQHAASVTKLTCLCFALIFSQAYWKTKTRISSSKNSSFLSKVWWKNPQIWILVVSARAFAHKPSTDMEPCWSEG